MHPVLRAIGRLHTDTLLALVESNDGNPYNLAMTAGIAAPAMRDFVGKQGEDDEPEKRKAAIANAVIRTFAREVLESRDYHTFPGRCPKCGKPGRITEFDHGEYRRIIHAASHKVGGLGCVVEDHCYDGPGSRPRYYRELVAS